MERNESENGDDGEDVSQWDVILCEDTEHRGGQNEQREDENSEIVDDLEELVWGQRSLNADPCTTVYLFIVVLTLANRWSCARRRRRWFW